MKVEFNDQLGIVSASGTLCKNKNGSRIVVMTRKAPSTNPCKMRMYIRPASSYQRATPISEKERQARNLFVQRQAYVQQLLASGKCKTKADAWKIAKQEII